MRIVFWGTPDFAIPSLRALLGEGHDVVAVVTQPDRPAGRGREVRPSPVKRIALEEGLPVLQPERARDDTFLAELQSYRPELSVVVAYGQILSRRVLDVPTLGSINVHASLLPELRGAAPINWAIIRGHRATGITIMRMAEKMDAGPILLQVPEPLAEDETASDLWSRLSELGAAALVEALTLMEVGVLPEVEQDDALATYAPRLTRASSQVDWGADADAVARQIRGLDAVPGAWTLWKGEDLKVFRPQPVPAAEAGHAPGTVLETDALNAAEGMRVACGSGSVWIREVKPAGKRRMTTADWLRGRAAQPGDRLG
jgi:methionyl-tRNA formyltransferase